LKNLQEARTIIRLALLKIAFPMTFQSNQKENSRIVYRVEGPQGQGVYSSPELWNPEDYLEFLSLEKNPLPEDDKGFTKEERDLARKDQIKDYLFGFSSVAQYGNWFTKQQIKLLTANGFSLVEKPSLEIRDSGSQIFFIPKEKDA